MSTLSLLEHSGVGRDAALAILEDTLRALAEQRRTTAGKIFQPLRVALTGLTVSPGIFDVLVALGKELAMTRLDEALTELTR